PLSGSGGRRDARLRTAKRTAWTPAVSKESVAGIGWEQPTWGRMERDEVEHSARHIELTPTCLLVIHARTQRLCLIDSQHLVAFSCKRRGFCPSCGARRVRRCFSVGHSYGGRMA